MEVKIKRNKIMYKKEFYKKFNKEWQKQLEIWKTQCEKCGGELGVRMVGDESYDYCSDCNWFNF